MFAVAGGGTTAGAEPFQPFTYGGPTEDVIKFYEWYKDPTLPNLAFPFFL